MIHVDTFFVKSWEVLNFSYQNTYPLSCRCSRLSRPHALPAPCSPVWWAMERGWELRCVGFLTVSLFSPALVCSRLILQKLTHIRRNQGISKAKVYSREPLWMLGLSLVILGSFADFAALEFGAQSIITPLGAYPRAAAWSTEASLSRLYCHLILI